MITLAIVLGSIALYGMIIPVVIRRRWVRQQTAVRRGEGVQRHAVNGQIIPKGDTVDHHGPYCGVRNNIRWPHSYPKPDPCNCGRGFLRGVFKNGEGYTRNGLVSALWPALVVGWLGVFAFGLTVRPVFRLSMLVAGFPARSLAEFVHPEVKVPDPVAIAALEAELPVVPDPLAVLDGLVGSRSSRSRLEAMRDYVDHAMEVARR